MKLKTIVFAAALMACAFAAQAINIETVPVGDVGNAGDTDVYTDGQGTVSYAYNIGKYEVTAGQYTAFLNAVAKTDTYSLYNTRMDTAVNSYGCNIKRTGTSGNYSYSLDSDWANRPVNFVSWGDAARFTNWLHNNQPSGVQGLSTTEDGAYYLNGATTDTALLTVSRESNWKWAITSEDEWYKAAYYKGSSTNAGYWYYTTSSDTAPGRDMADVSGNNANYYDGSGAYPIDSDNYTTLVGEFQNSASTYGTFDQGGNVWEWSEFVPSSSSRGFRGGAFYYRSDGLCKIIRFSSYPSLESGSVGFRVASVPEPGSIIMLAGIAVMSLLYFWRRKA